MFDLSDHELLEYIKEDLPYLDLTTYMQGCKEQRAKLDIYTREDTVSSCVEDSARMAELLGCEVTYSVPSSQKLSKGESLLVFEGGYEKVHQAWRSSQVILEYGCKIASYAHDMKALIKEVNPKCELLATRKTYPFAKKFCIKSILCGGAMPHRLGLSETVLFFAHHRIVYKNTEEFYRSIPLYKLKMPEKKIVVESKSIKDAIALLEAGADVLQLDKLKTEDISHLVSIRDQSYKEVKLLATGGINISNVQDYAKCGVDGIVTSAIYGAGMADIGCKMSCN